jgi:alpha-D-xyloside xylohydrolase
MRALAFDFREDPKALAIADEYLFGKALLVAPVVEKGATKRAVYLPGSDGWFDFWTGARVSGGAAIDADAPPDRTPVFARAGSIVPLGPVKPYADASAEEPLEVRVYPGRDAAFVLYDDAGEGYGYEKGEYALVGLGWDDRGNVLTIAAREGHYPGIAASMRLRVVCGSPSVPAREIDYTGSAVTVPLPGCR